MGNHQRRVLLNAIPMLLTVALLGYVVGAVSAPSTSSIGRARVGTQSARMLAISSPTVLAYPAASGWQATARAPQIPGLSIAQPLLLAPRGVTASTGLIAGRLTGGGPSPLPAQFFARMPQAPMGEVVDLMDSQAYRYRHVSAPGFHHTLTLYAIPNSTGTTLLVCYAPAVMRSTREMRTCEQIAAQLTLQAEAQSYELLTPDTGYARLVAAAIGHADNMRRTLRLAMRSSVSPANLAALATRLAAGLAGAAESLSTLQPPPVAGWAHAALSTALWRTRDAYSVLAAAAHAGMPARYAAARVLVDHAEASLGSALGSFALIGYA